MKLTKYIILVIALIVASCDSEEKSPTAAEPINATAPVQVVGLGRVEPEGKVVKVSWPNTGIIVKINKDEGQIVRQGEILIELDHQIEKAKLQQAASKYKTQQSRIRSKTYEVSEITARLSNKRQEYIRIKALLDKGSETQQRVDDLATEVQVLEASLLRTKSDLELLVSESDEILRERQLRQAELDYRFINAPCSGTLIQLDAVVGNSIEPGLTIAELAPIGKLVVRAEIDELFADRIVPGQSATIRAVGSASILTAGKVTYASASLRRKSLFSDDAGDQEDRRVREIKIELDKPDSLLINTRVECIINITR